MRIYLTDEQHPGAFICAVCGQQEAHGSQFYARSESSAPDAPICLSCVTANNPWLAHMFAAAFLGFQIGQTWDESHDADAIIAQLNVLANVRRSHIAGVWAQRNPQDFERLINLIGDEPSTE